MTLIDLGALRRFPDVEAENLHAVDASDRLILDLWAHRNPAPGTVAIIGDNYGALTVGALALGASGVRVHQDALTGERALGFNAPEGDYANHALDEELLAGAEVVLMQLPRSLGELDDQARAIAAWASPTVTVYAGGRIKHMTTAMNEVFARYFERVEVSLARQKSRVLTVAGARPTEPPSPRVAVHDGLRVAATGGVFAGTAIDIGTRVLLSVLSKAKPDAGVAIDLGCGTGVLAASLARSRAGARVIATDQSAAAVASAESTIQLNGLGDRVTVVRDDGLESQPDASADLIVLNPPFHVGASVHTGVALSLFADAARVLRPGGELWTVFNTHLGYRRELARVVGPTELVTHNAKFTVTASTRTPR